MRPELNRIYLYNTHLKGFLQNPRPASVHPVLRCFAGSPLYSLAFLHHRNFLETVSGQFGVGFYQILHVGRKRNVKEAVGGDENSE